MQHGTYFRAATLEVAAVNGLETEPPGDGWLLVSQETSLGLVAIRSLLTERGLITESDLPDVYWYLERRSGDEDKGGREGKEKEINSAA